MSLRERASPKELPEILCAIFIRLTDYQIRHSVLGVCRLWNAIGRTFHPCFARWTESLDQDDEWPFVEHCLSSGTDILHCQKMIGGGAITDRDSPTERLRSWTTLISAVKNLPTRQREQIKTLLLTGVIDNFSREMYPVFCGVTTLKLEKLGWRAIYLDTILRSCPQLEHLSIELPETDSRAERDLLFEHEEEALPVTKLQTLTLWRMNVGARKLRRLLLTCPELRELRLIRVDLSLTPEPILSSEIVARCPKLRALHFSLLNSSIPPRRHFGQLMAAFPTLDSWGTSVTDTGTWMYLHLRLHMTRTLTTLEIWKAARYGQEARFAKGLHEFLCAAPNLLHLRAGAVELYEEDLAPIETSTDEDEPTYNNTLNNNRVRKIWACRQLLTLQIGFRRHSSPVLNLTLASRKLLAFIANVCPKLSDLRIIHQKLDLGIEGGLCLLSELRNLRVLRIESLQGYLLWDEDLDWLRSDCGRVPWSQLRGKQKLEWNVNMRELRNSKVAKQEEIRMDRVKLAFSRRTQGTSRKEDEDKLAYRIQKASSLVNVFDVLDSLRMKEETCWPQLESLTLKMGTLHESAMEKNRETVRRLRPDINEVPPEMCA